jgi:hypothetical protein
VGPGARTYRSVRIGPGSRHRPDGRPGASTVRTLRTRYCAEVEQLFPNRLGMPNGQHRAPLVPACPVLSLTRSLGAGLANCSMDPIHGRGNGHLATAGK